MLTLGKESEEENKTRVIRLPPRFFRVLLISKSSGRFSHLHPTFMRSHISAWKDKLRRKASQCKPTEEQIAAAMAMKELGNEHFRAGQYKEADELYSQAYAS
jgi:hypothetical protein